MTDLTDRLEALATNWRAVAEVIDPHTTTPEIEEWDSPDDEANYAIAEVLRDCANEVAALIGPPS